MFLYRSKSTQDVYEKMSVIIFPKKGGKGVEHEFNISLCQGRVAVLLTHRQSWDWNAEKDEISADEQNEEEEF